MHTKPTLTVAAAFALWSAAAHAGPFEDTVIERYQDMGFQFIEVKEGLTQTKVEAIMADGRKVEVIYDRATGQILKQENERADRDEIALVGIEYDLEGEDFLDDEEIDDEDDEEDDDEDDEDDDEDESDESDEDDDEDDEDEDDEDDEDGDDDESADEGDDD